MTISGERTEQLDILCRIIGFTSDFLSFLDVELIRFFHGALVNRAGLWHSHCRQMPRVYVVEGACKRRLQKIFNIRQPISH